MRKKIVRTQDLPEQKAFRIMKQRCSIIIVGGIRTEKRIMFTKQIYSFAQTLDGLRSFVDLVDPFLDKKGREATKKHAGNLTPLILGFAKTDPDLLKQIGLTEARLQKLFKGNIKIKKGKGGDGPLFSISVSGPQGRAFDTAMSEISAARERISLLYQNSLISLVSAVECFLSQIIHTYFGTVPEAMSDRDKVFSFDDLNRPGFSGGIVT